jgi:hypothetical protein
MAEWRKKVGPENKCKEMEDAALAEMVEKTRKRLAEKVERDAQKEMTIEQKSRECFEAMRSKVLMNPSTSKMYRLMEGKPSISPIENMKPYYKNTMEHVSIAEDVSPCNNHPWGHGYVVDARGTGTGTGTVVDVAYLVKVHDDGKTNLPSNHPLQALTNELGFVHHNFIFADVTRVPCVLPTRVPSRVAGGFTPPVSIDLAYVANPIRIRSTETKTECCQS